MTTIKEIIRQANADGYFDDNAEAKVCQDVVLKAISESTLSRNVKLICTLFTGQTSKEGVFIGRFKGF